MTGCAIQPLTPTPQLTRTLPSVAVVAVIHTPTTTEPVTATPLPAVLLPTVVPGSAGLVTVELARPQSALEAATANVAPVIPEQPTQAPPMEAVSTPIAEDTAAAEQYTIDLINAQRAAAGVPLLARDETLMSIARARVADMTARGYTGHDDPITGAPLARQMMQAAGYASSYLGENWYGTIKAPPAIVDVAMGWFMIDPPHARNILSPDYVAVGVGIGYNGRQWLLIQNFAGANP